MKFAEAIKMDTEGFNELSPSRKRAVTGALDWIGDLSRLNGVNTGDWDINDVFGLAGKSKHPDLYHIKTKKSELTKAFFDHKGKVVAEDVGLPTELIEKLQKNTVEIYSTRMKHFEDQISSYKSSARDLMASSDSQLSTAHNKWVELQEMRARTVSVPDQIKQVLAGGNYVYLWDTFDTHKGGKITFGTTHDVVLEHKDSSKNLNIKLNMGRYRIIVDLKSLNIQVRGLERNIHINYSSSSTGSQAIHPHLNNGGICWGSGGSVRSNCQAEGNLLGIMDILHILLNTYNPGGPYVALESYYDESKCTPRYDCIRTSNDRITCDPCGYNYNESSWKKAKEQGTCYGCGESSSSIRKYPNYTVRYKKHDEPKGDKK